MSKVSLKNVLLSFPHLFSKQQRIKTMTFVSSKASDRGILLPFQPELHHTSKNNLFKGKWDCWYFMWFQMLKIFFHGWDRMEKTLNEMEGGRRVVGIVLLGPWDPQSPSCMSYVQSVSSLFALLPLLRTMCAWCHLSHLQEDNCSKLFLLSWSNTGSPQRVRDWQEGAEVGQGSGGSGSGCLSCS